MPERKVLPGFLLMTLALSLLAFGCAGVTSSTEKVTGGVKVQSVQETGVQPTAPPRTVYVEDFELEHQNLQADEGVRGHVGILQRLPVLKPTTSPAQEAHKLVSLMADSLVASLTEAGVSAQRIAPGAQLPPDGWLLHGAFVEVGEGNRLKRAVIGFGQGSTSMEVMVAVSDLVKRPIAPFIIFGTVKDPNMLPGAVVTMNPYMAAARFVMEKNAPEKDIKRTAKEIVAELQKYKDKFKQEAESSGPAK
ncbi:MAG: DUF4410 domain-containing protein [candidate division NC10 bacterium]|nr:DUF4410 domain-containing protein [candidate division NC10 bacterium]